MRQSYVRVEKKLSLDIRFSNHPKRKKRANSAKRHLRTIAGRLVREVSRLLQSKDLTSYQAQLELYDRVIRQKQGDKNKIYSLHEPKVQCISKGKEHKKYEFGNKSSIALTNSGIIVGALAFENNPYDGDTLEPQLDQIERLTDECPQRAVTDRGYRGRKKIGSTNILIPGQEKPCKQYQKNKVRNRFRRRAAIEPIIGHLKHDHRMLRNFLKGTLGDFINTILSAAAFNLKRLLNRLKRRFSNAMENFYDFISSIFSKVIIMHGFYPIEKEYVKNGTF